MKPWCLLLICLSCNLLRAGAHYFLRYRDEFLPHLLLAVATNTTITTITTAMPQPRCNDGYNLYPRPGRSFCFRYFTISSSWDSARTACQMENAELLVLDNESLEPFSDVMSQQVSDGSAWLGAKTDGNLNARYIGGSTIPSNSRLWEAEEPNTPNDCILLVFISNRASLIDLPCRENENYVCQHF